MQADQECSATSRGVTEQADQLPSIAEIFDAASFPTGYSLCLLSSASCSTADSACLTTRTILSEVVVVAPISLLI